MNCGPIVDSITSSKWQLGDGGSSDKKATDRADSRLANFYSAMAYPGSQLYNLAVKERWLLPEKWSGYLQHSYDTSPLPTKYLSGPEVPRFRDNAFNVYFNDPRTSEWLAIKLA